MVKGTGGLVVDEYFQRGIFGGTGQSNGERGFAGIRFAYREMNVPSAVFCLGIIPVGVLFAFADGIIEIGGRQVEEAVIPFMIAELKSFGGTVGSAQLPEQITIFYRLPVYFAE
jgi:hypothetical protein